MKRKRRGWRKRTEKKTKDKETEKKKERKKKTYAKWPITKTASPGQRSDLTPPRWPAGGRGGRWPVAGVCWWWFRRRSSRARSSPRCRVRSPPRHSQPWIGYAQSRTPPSVSACWRSAGLGCTCRCVRSHIPISCIPTDVHVYFLCHSLRTRGCAS